MTECIQVQLHFRFYRNGRIVAQFPSRSCTCFVKKTAWNILWNRRLLFYAAA